MKLELQHLACYLPYGLDFITQSGKVFKSQTKDDFEIRIFKGNSPNGNKQYHSLTLGKINRGEFKPLLRPLSDLDDSQLKSFNFVSFAKAGDIDFVSYDFMKYAFENHFDVFGLIDKGLAIDINTINQ